MNSIFLRIYGGMWVCDEKARHDDGLFEGTERFFRPNYVANLVALAMVPGVLLVMITLPPQSKTSNPSPFGST